MSEYSSSAATKLSLINAAGALFAEQGVDNVTTRDIAEAANENKGSIHYHFGGKDGLLAAVLAYAAQPWKDDPMGSCLKANEALLGSSAGQEKLVGELIDIFFSKISSNEVPRWCNTLVFRVLQKDVEISGQVFETCVKPSIGALVRLYVKATGDDDPVRAYAWADSTLSPIILQAINPNVPRRFFRGGKTPAGYFEFLKDFSKTAAVTWLRKAKLAGNGAAK